MTGPGNWSALEHLLATLQLTHCSLRQAKRGVSGAIRFLCSSDIAAKEKQSTIDFCFYNLMVTVKNKLIPAPSRERLGI